MLRQFELSPSDLAKQFDAFVVEAHRLRVKYQSQVTLLVGAETEFITQVDQDGLTTLLNRHGKDIEYLVGSIHHVYETPIDFDQETFEKLLERTSPSNPDVRMDVYLTAYFEAQYKMIETYHPEIIGHIDLCRLYRPALRLKDYPRAWSQLEKNVALAVRGDALFEINAAAFRKGWDTAYPGRDVAEVCITSAIGYPLLIDPVGQLIVKMNGRFVLSDDSHGPHAVGLNYSRLLTYLLELGIEELWYLDRCDQPNARGRYTHAVKVEGDWYQHKFWERKVAA